MQESRIGWMLGVGCRIGGRRDRRDVGQEGCSKGRLLYRKNEDSRNSG